MIGPTFPVAGVKLSEDGWICACPKGKSCEQPGKHPLVKGGYQSATEDGAKWEYWHRRWPEANVGFPTGSMTGYLVVDVDTRHNGQAYLDQVRQLQPDLDQTLVTETGGGGRHYWLKLSKDTQLNSRIGLWPGIDIRSNGGYVLIPPSRHVSGGEYLWLNDSAPVPLSPSLAGRLEERKIWTGSLNGNISPIESGSRNATLFAMVCAKRAQGMERSDALDYARRINHTQCDPPLGEEEVLRIVENATRYDPDIWRNDLGNADRLERLCQGNVRWTRGLGWLEWNGVYWEQVDETSLYPYMRTISGMILTEARDITDEDEAKRHFSWGKQCGEGRRVSSALGVFKGQGGIGMSVEAFERHKMLLTCRNGALSLEDGSFSENKREHYMLYGVDVLYNPDASCPIWMRCLDEWFNHDQGLMGLAARFFGYCLTGRVDEQHLFILHGPGQNGKTTFCEVLQTLMGPHAYSTVVNTELIMERGRLNEGTELADLLGKRVAVCSESAQFHRLNEERVKTLTGGDRLKGRRLYRDSITFEPTHKLILYTNHLPQIRDTSEAMRRRVRLIPFNVIIPPEKRDSKLKDRLIREELPGILNWAIKGCLSWQKLGSLGFSPSLLGQSDEYMKNEDVIGGFLDEECVISQEYRETAQKIWQSYQAWCIKTGNRSSVRGRNGFYQELRRRGWNIDRGHERTPTIRGIQLREVYIDGNIDLGR